MRPMTPHEILDTGGHGCPECGEACDCPWHFYDEETDTWAGCGHCS